MTTCDSPTSRISSAAPATISVVVPLYNKRTEIRRALASVHAQTCRPAEIIVVDDGSTDGSADVVAQMSDLGPLLRLVRQPNAGVSAARNRGVALARGAIVALLDADDVWMPWHLESVARLSGRYPDCDVFAAAYVIRTGRGADRLPTVRSMRRADVDDDDAILEDYFTLASRSDPPLCSSSVAVTRHAIEQIGGFPAGVAQGEDLLTWARLAARFRIAYCARPSAVIWNAALESARPTRAPEPDDRVGRELRRLLAQAPAAALPAMRRYVSLWHRMRGSMFLALGDRRAANREFCRARRFAFWSPRLLVKSMMTFLPLRAVHTLIEAWTRRSRHGVIATATATAASYSLELPSDSLVR
jgi:glycosyltransferase involved in cell wall biosynthesis